jgi:hypothetical protein
MYYNWSFDFQLVSNVCARNGLCNCGGDALDRQKARRARRILTCQVLQTTSTTSRFQAGFIAFGGYLSEFGTVQRNANAMDSMSFAQISLEQIQTSKQIEQSFSL